MGKEKDLVECSRKVLQAAVELCSGQVRPQQEQMEEAVAETLENGGHLIVQAGTGVGKSLGYLVPLMTKSALDGRVQLVSTASLALQRQILSKDAPLVAQAVKELLGTNLKTESLKGWGNYLCRLRLRNAEGAEQNSEGLLWADPKQAKNGQEQVEKVLEWVDTTDTGDRDDVPFPVSDIAWRQVSVSRRECIGRQCPFYDECFAARAKEKAFAADVVITNHTLLGIYASDNTDVLPAFDALVVDEAHDLVSRVRSQGTQTLSAGLLRRAERAVRPYSASGAKDLAQIQKSFTKELEKCREGRLSVRSEALSAIFRDLDDAVRQIRPSLKDSSGSANQASKLQTARAQIDQIAEVIEVWAAPTEKTVLWVNDSKTGLNIAPLDVASGLSRNLFSQHATILASATLSAGGTFDHVRRQTGIDWSKKQIEELDVGSAFDAKKQGILYVADHLPDPGKNGLSEQTFEVLQRLVEAACGGCLGLFSSRRAAERAAELMRETSDVKVLLQGEDTLPSLVRQYRDDPDACLFGTISLWQGVDIPGLTNRLVIIDRIPFPRPDDPIVQALSGQAQETGRNAFMETSLAPAVLLMAQGAGRLLRSPEDRGVVAILDPRITRKSYGSYVRKSLPDFWPTQDLDLVCDALQRLSEQICRKH